MNATEKKKLDSLLRREAAFIEPMECALVTNVPDGSQWVCGIKLIGYRAITFNSLTVAIRKYLPRATSVSRAGFAQSRIESR
jgi:hypothetical protein